VKPSYIGEHVRTWHGDTGEIVDPNEYTGPNAGMFRSQGRTFVRFDRDVYDGGKLAFRAGEIAAFGVDLEGLTLITS
jgi:hypothetical protein